MEVKYYRRQGGRRLQAITIGPQRNPAKIVRRWAASYSLRCDFDAFEELLKPLRILQTEKAWN